MREGFVYRFYSASGRRLLPILALVFLAGCYPLERDYGPLAFLVYLAVFLFLAVAASIPLNLLAQGLAGLLERVPVLGRGIRWYADLGYGTQRAVYYALSLPLVLVTGFIFLSLVHTQFGELGAVVVLIFFFTPFFLVMLGLKLTLLGIIGREDYYDRVAGSRDYVAMFGLRALVRNSLVMPELTGSVFFLYIVFKMIF